MHAALRRYAVLALLAAGLVPAAHAAAADVLDGLQRKEGFLEANVELALAHPQLGPGFREYLKKLEL